MERLQGPLRPSGRSSNTRRQGPDTDHQPLAGDFEEIEDAYKKDPVSAACEWGAEFRPDGSSAFFRSHTLESSVIRGRFELPPEDAYQYLAWIDMASGASGSGHDSAAVAIAHPVGGKYVVDAMRERQPPFDPRQVLWEFAELAKRYIVIEASGDDWAKGFVSGGLSDFGLTYVKPPKLDKTAVYHELLYLVNSGQVEFLDDKRLMSQFVQLERKSGSTLKFDHPTGGHDDLANAVAGSIVMAAGVGTRRATHRS